MPDTPENQAMYPQPPNQKPGLEFSSMARITVLLSLATGECHDLAIAPYAGKGTGEKTLFRRMYDRLKPGDVRLFALSGAASNNYFPPATCAIEVSIWLSTRHFDRTETA